MPPISRSSPSPASTSTADGLPNYNAQVLVFFIITVAAAEVAVGLAIIVALYRARQTTHVEDIASLKYSRTRIKLNIERCRRSEPMRLSPDFHEQ